MKANYLPLIEFVQDILCHSSKVKDFDDLDDIQQDQFYALYLKAVDDDSELFLDDRGMSAFRKFLITYDQDFVPDIIKSLRDGMWEKTYRIFNDILAQENADSYAEQMQYHGRRKHIDNINGEVRWI